MSFSFLNRAAARDFFAAALLFLKAEKEQLFLWSPVSLGLGIGTYFALPFEPPFAPTIAILAITATLFLFKRNAFLAKTICLSALGFTLTLFAAHFYGTPMIDHPMGPVYVEGNVLEVEQRGQGMRLLLENLRISNISTPQTPVRLHLTLSPRVMEQQGIESVHAGQHLRAVAEILPLSEPYAPNSFDFRRNGFFQSLGGTGYVMGKLDLTDAEEQTSPYRVALNQLREKLQLEIKKTLSGDEAGLAIILLTGDKTHLSDETAEAMRSIGLAHLLAIAGLHIGIVAAFAFGISRFLLALFPFLALRINTKKLSTLFTLIAIVCYTLQVGAPVPTRRALLMTSVALLGILTNRISISLRTVSLAAFLILLIWPQLLLHPSFQLSFAAVTALIAVHGITKEKEFAPSAFNKSFLGKIKHHIGTLAGMSFVATIATLPASLYHFQEAELYSILANTLAIPLTSLMLMPLCVFVDILWPFGLAEWPLRILQFGLHGLIKLSTYIASLPGAYYKPPMMPVSFLIISTFGGLCFCFFRTKLRYAGLVLMALPTFWCFFLPRPDILLSPDAQNVGWIDKATQPDEVNKLTIMSQNKPNHFLAEAWAPLAGIKSDKAVFAGESNERPTATVRCDSLACVQTRDQGLVIWVKDPNSFKQACESRPVLIISPETNLLCPQETGFSPTIINKQAFYAHGAHAVFWENNTPRLLYQRATVAARPWDAGWKRF